MERTFSATTEGLAGCQAFLDGQFDTPKPQIIMDEVVSNIVRCSGATQFSVRIERHEKGLVTMIFSDDGRAFDPTKEVPEPDVTASVADRAIGGLGFFMVKKMSRRVWYERQQDRNVLFVELDA